MSNEEPLCDVIQLFSISIVKKFPVPVLKQIKGFVHLFFVFFLYLSSLYINGLNAK